MLLPPYTSFFQRSHSDLRHRLIVLEFILTHRNSAKILPRECTNNYHIPGTKTVIEKGTDVFISVLGLHRDPKYYPNNFEPDRFYKQNASNFSLEMQVISLKCHICLLASNLHWHAKVGLTLILQKSTLYLPENAPHDLKMSPRAFVMTANDGTYLKVRTRVLNNRKTN